MRRPRVWIQRTGAARVAITQLARWPARLSGPIVAAVIGLLVLWRGMPASPPRPMPPPTVTPARLITTRIAAQTALPTGCHDPAISGCDAYSACAIAVAITSGLAPDPARTLADGLDQCAAGVRAP